MSNQNYMQVRHIHIAKMDAGNYSHFSGLYAMCLKCSRVGTWKVASIFQNIPITVLLKQFPPLIILYKKVFGAQGHRC